MINPRETTSRNRRKFYRIDGRRWTTKRETVSRVVRRESNASRASTSINSALCIIRLWIIRGTRRTRTFRSETGQPCQPLCNFNQPMFVCPLAIESRSCLCRRCRRYCRRSTDRRAIESERRWLLIYTGKRERFRGGITHDSRNQEEKFLFPFFEKRRE